MKETLSGLVFPQDLLVTPQFLLLATIVAFNTIVYVGLTISKFLLWPRQFKPRSMRGPLRRAGLLPPEGGVITPPVAGAPVEPYDKIRADIVRRDIPFTMALVGIALVIISVINFALTFASFSVIHVSQLLAGLAYVVAALVAGRQAFGAEMTTRLWALMSFLAVAMVAVEAIHEGNLAPLGYALIFMAAFAPITMAWAPAMLSMAGQLGFFTFATFAINDVQAAQLAVVGLVAAGTGLVLLRMRLQSIEAIAQQWEATQKAASTDVLTGLLARRGLLGMLPPFVATAQRQQQRMSVTVVQIRNLGPLSMAYGTAYSDEVLRATARALGSTVNRSFLVSRWVGAQFVVVGFGVAAHDVFLERRLVTNLDADPITLGRAAPVISVASAEGPAEIAQFDNVYDAALSRVEAPRVVHAAVVR